MPGYRLLICHLLKVHRFFAKRTAIKSLVLGTGCLVLDCCIWGQTCTITQTHTDVVCYGENSGSINISVGGGTEPYIFSWTGTGSFTSTSQNLTSLEAGSYTVIVNGASGSCSGTATIVIDQPSQPLTIITQPLDQSDCYGNTVEFSVNVSGAIGTISYQWQSRPPGGNFTDISGANSSILTIHDIGVNRQNIDGTEFQVVITDNCETITSETALLSINSITDLSGRVNLTICNGESTIYEVSAHGSITGYQWSFNDGTGWDPISDGGAWSGATTSQLSIANATTSESGSYRVSITFSTLNQPPDYPTCVITSHSRTRNLTVLPPVSPSMVSAAQTVCYDGVPAPLNATPASGGSGPDYSYQWQSSADGNSWTNINGAQALSYSPPGLTASTWYRIVATDEGPLHCGTVCSLPIEITVDPLPVATITASGPTTFCEGVLVVLTSSLASSYLWSTGETTQEITVISSGSYSVTVSDDCGNTSTCSQAIEVTDNVTPVFAQIGPLCQNSIAPPLPETSINGIAGSWNPSSINTSTGGTSTYTFTPDSGQCATTATMDIIVTTSITPTFTQIGPFCQNTVAPALPTNSDNGISGTWNPETINTSTVGSSTYAFTPDAGQCAVITNMIIEVTNSIIPIFTQIGPLCQNSAAPILPATSNNGISGTWNPEIISTVTVGTSTYAFVPDAGQCAASATMSIEITTSITPAFTQIGPLCQGSVAPLLPGTSNNNITGSWDPAVISTANVGTFTYNFTPNAGQCATSTTMNIEVTTSITPTFSQIGPLVQNSTPPTLPTTSTNGITGVWNPAVINTSTPGTYTFTFTPSAGQCATAATMDIAIANLAISVIKTVDRASISAPITLNYTITVSNSGTAAMTGISVSDPFAGGAVYTSGDTDGDNILDLAETWTYTAEYAATQADINTGADLVNIVSVTSSQVTTPVTAQAVTTITNQRPDITITKTANETSFSSVGTVIHCTIVVRNTGNATLTNILVTDPLTGLNRTVATLTPGASITTTATHVITQNDLNRGYVDNTATASYSFGGSTFTQRASVRVPGSQNHEFTITKIASETNFAVAGDIIHYTITIRNTGNVTLTGVVANDSYAVVNCSGAPRTLTPNASMTCTAVHTVTSADVNAGRITNVAIVTGYDPGMHRVTATSNTVTVSLNNVAPLITCPQPIVSGTSATTCSILVNADLNTVYSDPNDNVESLTWVMTGTTAAASPVTGIHNLDSYTFNRGITTVTYTVTDAFGLSATCSFTVTVNDNMIPDVVCRDIPVYLDLNTGIASITPSDINNGSSDNCGIASMAIDIDHFDCTDIGPNNVTLTVIDNSGNIGRCTTVVTVNYAANPIVTPITDVICDGETTNIELTCDIPSTAWTWSVNASPEISGASDDNSSLRYSISQTLLNLDNAAHNVIYNIVPRVYGQCDLPAITAEVWVNPEPEILISSADTVACNGESVTISVNNLNGLVHVQWMYDLTVIPDPGITGYRTNGTFTTTESITENLTNNDTRIHKVTYRFTPRIVPDDGGPACTGLTKTINIWVFPRLEYTKEVSDYNGFNISCYGKSTGFIKIDPAAELAPFIFSWNGPDGFTSSKEDIFRLKTGQYTLVIIDRNMCTTRDTFELTEPERFSMTIEPSVSLDGNYNINCFGAQTGYVNLSAINNVGQVDYLWADGYIGSRRPNMSAGTYKIILMDSNNCHADSTVNLTEPDEIHIDFDVTEPFCPEKPDGEIKLAVTGGILGNGYTYRWFDNSTRGSISNIPAGYYSVIVFDMNGCSVKDSVRLKGMNEICLILPEAISPNKDLINDVWNIENIYLYPKAEITIYNRWGQMIWYSDPGYPVPWDGRSRGEGLPIDSYHYFIDLNNGSKPIIGVVTVVR